MADKLEIMDIEEYNKQNNIQPKAKVDRRKQTSSANLAKARQTKLQKLKEQKNNPQAQVNKKISKQIPPIKSSFELDQTDSSDEEEEYVYYAPVAKQKKTKGNDNNKVDQIEEIRMMLQKMMKDNDKESISSPPPSMEPPKELKKQSVDIVEQVSKSNNIDPLKQEMKRKILNF